MARVMTSDAASAVEEKVTIFVWEFPVRLVHWTVVLALGVLTVTGIYIASPFIGTTGRATEQYLMGTMRLIHLITAFVFTAAVLLRIYWAFAGNQFAQWHQWLPSTRARWQGMWRMLRYYTFFRPRSPEMVGHNPLAGMTYLGLYTLFAVQIATGFALLSLPDHSGWVKGLFGWIVLTFGAQPVRMLHDLLMYLFLAFAIHHVYSAVLIDLEERSGLLSSIITGYKSFTKQHLIDAADQVPVRRQRPQRIQRGAS
jgi:Ni/Fe-hydrogenase 1 B-type cytochrome subunit